MTQPNSLLSPLLHSLLSYGFLSLGILWSLATAAQPSPELLALELDLAPPKRGNHYRPDETLRLQLSNNLTHSPQLSVELNNIDISALVQHTGEQLSYQPIQPLAPGAHELRVLVYSSDGQVQELGYWQVNVQAARDRSFDAGAYLDLALTQRLDDKLLADGQPHSLLHGSGTLIANSVGESVNSQFSGDLFYTSELEQAFGGRRLDMDNFSLAVANQHYGLQLGNQQLGQASLVYDGYLRRGIATRASLPGNKHQLEVFGVSNQQLYGMSEGLGVSDGDNRSLGARWQSLVHHTEKTEVHLGGSYVRGRRQDLGFGVYQSEYLNLVQEGDAWNLVLDTYFRSRQWRLRLEGASSQFDLDGADLGEDERSDQAYSALLIYTSTPDTGAGLQWHSGLEATQVGRFFYSLTNNQLAADKRMERWFGHWAGSRWFGEWTAAQQHNNLDEDLHLATTDIRQGQFKLGYSQPGATDNSSLLALLGSPIYTLDLHTTQGEDSYTPQQHTAIDYRARGGLLMAQFSHQRWSWSLGYGLDGFDDFSNQQIDTRTRSINLGAQLNLSERFHLGAQVQAQTTHNLDYNTFSRARIYNVHSQFILVPEKISGSLQWGLNGNSALDDPFFERDDQTQYYSAELNWRLREADTNRLGFELGLSFSSMSYRNQLESLYNQQGHQVMLTLRSTLPASFSRGY